MTQQSEASLRKCYDLLFKFGQIFWDVVSVTQLGCDCKTWFNFNNKPAINYIKRGC